MKFNKSFLFATLMASALVLTACNDKDSKTTQTQTTEVAKETKSEMDAQLAQASAEFNKVAKVSVSKVDIAQDGSNFSVTYSIENLSDKAISSLQWATLYKSDNNVFYVANTLPIQFVKTLAPKATESIVLSTSEEAVLSQIRPHLANGKSIQLDILGTTVNFADGSTIGLTQQAPATQK